MSAATVLGWEGTSRAVIDVHLAWRNAREMYADHLKRRRYKPSTIQRYGKTARRLSMWAQRDDRRIGPWQMQTEDLQQFLSTSTTSPSSSNELLRTVTYFYDWAALRGYVSPSPAAALPRRRLGEAPTPEGWQQAWSDFRRHLHASGKSQGTVNLRRLWILRFAEYCGPIGPFEVQMSDLEDWLASGKWAPNTRKLAQSSLSVFYTWAERSGHVVSSPTRDLTSVRVPRGRPQPTPERVIDSSLAKADERERLMVLLASQAGLRAMEIAGLHSRDVDFSICLDDGLSHLGGTLYVLGKGGVRRTVPLAPDGELVMALQAWVGSRTNWVFPGNKDGHLSAHYVSRLLSRLLGPGTSGHKLRHRFASMGFAGTRDLRAMQELLGHSKPETTAIYTAVVDGSLMDTVMAASRRPLSHR